MADYQIFTDATADLSPEMLSGLPPVEIIPMHVEIGGKAYTYGPSGTITPIENNLDLRPGSIIGRLQLCNPIYASTTNYGHFGNSCFSWEQIDDTLIKSLKQLLVKHMV